MIQYSVFLLITNCLMKILKDIYAHHLFDKIPKMQPVLALAAGYTTSKLVIFPILIVNVRH
ncbi:hypothetical protein HanPI659440_Chr00c03g0710871 [Helianthus annuus]|nr:hypothetical protein HanPI659440_Chr00c03g0710871 [Helianthus annuus]